MNWQTVFPNVFNQPSRFSNLNSEIVPSPREPGFDAVIGNPPWERIKLQEREFFAFAEPDIASAVSAATRRKLIEKLQRENPELYSRYLAKQSDAEKTSTYVRSCGRFPLTAKGDINTYMLFAELARTLVASNGRVGLLVPSGIATDSTTKDYFADLIEAQALIKLYDFENRLGIFPDVDNRFKFCILILSGDAVKTQSTDFVFFAHSMADLEAKRRHIVLSKRDIAQLNPNTKTCPIFRTRNDAEITKRVYERVPILIDQNRKEGGNPWGVKFQTLFHQTNDAEHFEAPETLAKKSFKLHGNRFIKAQHTFLPLYEAKMVQAFDHRAASIEIEAGNWMRQGQTVETSVVSHQNPEFVAIPRWWVNAERVYEAIKPREYFIAFKDITSPTNQRTMIASAIPFCAAHNHLVILNTRQSARLELCLLGNLNSFAYDYIARQKIGGVTLNFFIVEQLPTLPPDIYDDAKRWTKKQTLEQWISDRVLKLSCTSNDMVPLAKACKFHSNGSLSYVWKWREPDRTNLRAELDAAFFILYGYSRDEACYILSTFQDTGASDDGRTISPNSNAELILSFYDSFADK